MTAMTERELDAWIAEHVMRFEGIEVNEGIETEVIVPGVGIWQPTTNGDHALKVLKKCAEKVNCSNINMYLREDYMWVVWCGEISSGGQCTLEKAICRFAYELFNERSER